MSDQTDREAKLREIAKKTVRDSLPGTERVFVRTEGHTALRSRRNTEPSRAAIELVLSTLARYLR